MTGTSHRSKLGGGSKSTTRLTGFTDLPEETEDEGDDSDVLCKQLHEGDLDSGRPDGHKVPDGGGPSAPGAALGGVDDNVDALLGGDSSDTEGDARGGEQPSPYWWLRYCACP